MMLSVYHTLFQHYALMFLQELHYGKKVLTTIMEPDMV